MIEQGVVQQQPAKMDHRAKKTNASAHAALDGKVKGLKRLLPFLGPAFIAAVAYLDPGNFATNITAGSKYGYLLLWVIAASNLMAVLIQTLSAKLGIATGKNLPEVAHERFPKGVFDLFVDSKRTRHHRHRFGRVYRGGGWGFTCCSASRCCRPPLLPRSVRSRYWSCSAGATVRWKPGSPVWY
ncbi:hypothetical protein HMSSN036_41090 [Paenibacillus macerans]|nr:hypothetical protein HMSSN036_41090 [Paenibacillus macerans]